MDFEALWKTLGWPLTRMLVSLSVGLFVANVIESLNWTRAMAVAARPLIVLGRMKDVVGASFSMAFFSGLTANTMLAEAFDKGEITRRELILANLFNSLPTYFLHLPTMASITAPFIGMAAFWYIGLTFASAVLRTACITLLGHFLLPPLPVSCPVCRLEDKKVDFSMALAKSWGRFKRRIRGVALYSAPVYVAMHYAAKYGMFAVIERFMAEHAGFLSWLNPKAVTIVVFHMAAEFSAGLGAAAGLLAGGDLSQREVVLALLLGNVLSTPMRAFRHQFPYYAGIFRPAMAARLLFHNQLLRAVSIIIVGLLYYFLT
jgi:hypothetical protein